MSRSPQALAWRSILALLLAGAGVFPALAGQGEVTRIAILVGNNVGQPGHAPLKYAQADAQRFGKVLTEVGGFRPADVHLLVGEDEGALQRTLAGVSRHVLSLEEGTKVLLLFYFSGHSGGKYLEMGADEVPFKKVRRWMEESGAQVRMVVVDTCLSAELVGIKGIHRAPSFDIDVQGELQTEGTVVLTSTGAGEVAQETGDLEGSYFTHHMVSGLYGAADEDNDLSVTLKELYRYTYRKTLGDTVGTLAGTQHPSYDVRLEGRGELVLSTVNRNAAVVSLPRALKGELFLVSLPQKVVIAEVGHKGDRVRRLYVAAGDYELFLRAGKEVRSGRLRLEAGAEHLVSPTDLTETEVSIAALRGPRRRPKSTLWAAYGLSGWFLPEMGALHSASLLYARRYQTIDLHLRLSWGMSAANGNLLVYDVSALEAGVAALFRFPFPGFDLLAGPIAGLSRLVQTSDELNDRTAFSPLAGLQAGLAAHPTESLSVLMTWEFDLYLFELDGSLQTNFGPRGTLGAGYRF